MEETRLITKKETISYAIGGFGKNLAYGLVATYTLYYYNAVLGISAAFVGVLLMAARIFDAFNDPLMGVIVAKTKSRYGKYRPWIFTGALTNAFVLFAMFSVPQPIQGDGLKVFVTITYFLCGITYTLSDIPYWSIIPAATRAGRERENLTLYARTFSGIGAALPMIIGMALVVWLGSLGRFGAISGERLGFSLLALITAIIYIISTIITLKNLPAECHEELAGDYASPDPTVGELLTSLVRNSHAMWIAAVIILFNTSIYMMMNLAVYLFRYDIGDYSQYTVFMSISGVTQFAAMVAFYPLLRKKHSNRWIFIFGCCAGIIGFAVLLPLIGVRSLTLWHMILPAIGISFANGIAYVLTTVFVAGAVDYGEQLNGRRDESVVSSLQTLMVKMSSAFAVLIAGIGLDFISLSEATAAQSAASILGLRILFIVPPMVLMALAVLIFVKHKSLGCDLTD